MQDAVHVEIKIVKLRQEGGIRHDLVDLGVSLRYPSVKLGNTHIAVIVAAAAVARGLSLVRDLQLQYLGRLSSVSLVLPNYSKR